MSKWEKEKIQDEGRSNLSYLTGCTVQTISQEKIYDNEKIQIRKTNQWKIKEMNFTIDGNPETSSMAVIKLLNE